MPIIITDQDNISTVHTAERLQINLATANENVDDMTIEVFFTVESKLPNGKTVGLPYWDNQPLIISCKGDKELTDAMKVIQTSIGNYRYKQLTTPKPIPEPPKLGVPEGGTRTR